MKELEKEIESIYTEILFINSIKEKQYEIMVKYDDNLYEPISETVPPDEILGYIHNRLVCKYESLKESYGIVRCK